MGALLGSSRRGRDHVASRRHHPTRQGEEGFTLIELLIVLVILPLVVGAITMVLITTLKSQQGIQGKITDASAATTASAYYVRDIESAATVTTSASPSAPPQCSTSGVSGTPKFLLGLQLQGTSPVAVVSYYELTPTSGGPAELVRFYCSGVTTSHVILSDNVSTTDPPTPVVNCITPTPTSIPTGVMCNPGTDWTFTYMVSTVTLNVTQGCATAGCGPYQYALTGNPVSGVPVPPIVQPNGVLTLRGIGTDIQFGGLGETVCAGGPIVLNSGFNSTGNPAISSGSGDTVASGCTAAPASTPAVDVHDCLMSGSDGAACPTSGTNTTIGSPKPTVAPQPMLINETVVDPLANWASLNPVQQVTTPTISGLAGCSTANHISYTCPQGEYPNGLSIGDNKTVTFQPPAGQTGHFQFGTTANAGDNCNCALIVGNNDTVYFGTGHYTFEGGLQVNGSSSNLCGGVVSSSCPQATTGGVFFYVAGGQVTVGGFTFGDSVQLAPITSTDPYANVVLWQDGTDTDQLQLYGFNTTFTTTGGTVYAPNAQIEIIGVNTGAATLATGDIVANSLQLIGVGTEIVAQ